MLTSEERGPLLAPGWRVVIGGQTGAGKTVIGLHILRAVVLREKFLDWTGGGGRCLVIDLEQGLRTVQRRLEECGLSQNDDVDYCRIPDGLALDTNIDAQNWLEKLLEDGEYAVVMVDPLYKLHRADPNDERAMVALMALLDGWREKFGFALLLPAHLRKSATTGRSKPSIDDISGAGAVVRGAEVVIGLQLLSGLGESGEGIGKSRLYWWKDRDGDLPVGMNWQLNFQPRKGFWRDTSVKVNIEDEVLGILAAVWPTGYSVPQLAEITGKTEKTVRRGVKIIRERGVKIEESIGDNNSKVLSLAEVYDDEAASEEWEA